jgi:hypothetical protein
VPPPIGPCFGPTQRAEVAAQELKGRRAGPALGTIDHASGWDRVVLFRVVPRAANRARPIWKSITFDAPPRAAAAMRRGAPRGECEGEHGEPYCFGKNKGGATHGGPDGYGGWADVDIS